MTPGVPLNRVVGVLKKVRAGFLREPVRTSLRRSLCHRAATYHQEEEKVNFVRPGGQAPVDASTLAREMCGTDGCGNLKYHLKKDSE